MTGGVLFRAWVMLCALTVASTALHLSLAPPRLAGCAILAMAGFKARLILLDYLELRGVRNWASGLQWIIAAYLVLLTGLFLAV